MFVSGVVIFSEVNCANNFFLCPCKSISRRVVVLETWYVISSGPFSSICCILSSFWP